MLILVHAYMHAYMHVCIRACMHVCMFAYSHWQGALGSFRSPTPVLVVEVVGVVHVVVAYNTSLRL